MAHMRATVFHGKDKNRFEEIERPYAAWAKLWFAGEYVIPKPSMPAARLKICVVLNPMIAATSDLISYSSKE